MAITSTTSTVPGTPLSAVPDTRVGPGDRQAGDRGTGDRVAGALAALADAIDENAADERLLAQRIRDLSRARAGGASWMESLTGEAEPGTVQLVSRILARISAASGTLRKALVLALRQEGVSIPAIARLFGVTHQRVSNLLRGSSH